MQPLGVGRGLVSPMGAGRGKLSILICFDRLRYVALFPLLSGVPNINTNAHLSWRSSLVENGIKVIEKLGVRLSGRALVASQRVLGRDLGVGN